MLKNIATTLSVAAITGLAALGWTSPPIYRVVAPWIALLATAAVFLFFIWSWGAESATDFSKPSAQNPMLRAVYAIGIWLSLLALMAFFYFVPSLLSGARAPLSPPTTTT